MALPDIESCDTEPLTAKYAASQQCSNPFCHAPTAMEPKRGKKSCCDRCRMDGYVLRRARAMLDEVGIIRLNMNLPAG